MKDAFRVILRVRGVVYTEKKLSVILIVEQAAFYLSHARHQGLNIKVKKRGGQRGSLGEGASKSHAR